jgi:hypothetical protein
MHVNKTETIMKQFVTYQSWNRFLTHMHANNFASIMKVHTKKRHETINVHKTTMNQKLILKITVTTSKMSVSKIETNFNLLKSKPFWSTKKNYTNNNECIWENEENKRGPYQASHPEIQLSWLEVDLLFAVHKIWKIKKIVSVKYMQKQQKRNF